MFSQTFVDGTRRTRKPYAVALSLLLQIAVVGLLILVPLLYTQTLPDAQLKSMLMAPLPPPAPKLRTVVEVKPAVVRALSGTRLVAPTAIPKRINMVVAAPAALDLGSVTTVSGTGENGNPLLFGSTGSSNPSPPPFIPTAKPKAAAGPVRVGGVVAEANILHRVQPLYPPLAKSARVQGSVEFTALISKNGRVENLQLVRGHPLLVNAAREAILQWLYRPTMLNGEPVDVLTSISVNFKLTE